MSKWICISEPNTVLLELGAYKCEKCNRPVIVAGPGDTVGIEEFYYCPYCGDKKEISINERQTSKRR